jgi:phage-related protein
MKNSGSRRPPKVLEFISGTRDEISEMPLEVKRAFGFDLRMLQNGDMPPSASPFEGGRANEVMKLTERHDGDTYRCVYAAKFEKAVFVLHVFMKKSTSGIATPQKEIDTVYMRLAAAKEFYREHYGED